MTDFKKWADCPLCRGKGCLLRVKLTGRSDMKPSEPYQCPCCELHFKVCELEADVKFFREHGGRKTATEIHVMNQENEIRAEAWYQRERALVELRAEVEQLQVQLAGCSVAANGNATGGNDCKQGDYGYSVAFDDVKRLRSERDMLRAALEDMVAEKSGKPKSCGHEWTCVCASIAAVDALARAKDGEIKPEVVAEILFTQECVANGTEVLTELDANYSTEMDASSSAEDGE